MSRHKTVDHDNPEWTADDFARALPASALPDHIRNAFPRTRGPRKAATKVPVSIRLSPEVVDYFKAGVPIEEIASYLGHTNPNITRSTYSQFSPEYLRKAASALELQVQ